MILTINGGSSSIKFALYQAGATELTLVMKGKIDRVGTKEATLSFRRAENAPAASAEPSVSTAAPTVSGELPVAADDLQQAGTSLADWLEQQPDLDRVTAIGHRIVHGMEVLQTTRIDEALLRHLRNIQPYDPDHLPGEIQLIETFRGRYPRATQVACFDTAFHADMPRVASQLPIPRRFDAEGIRRYGFHGLSYEYILKRLGQLVPPYVTNGRMIFAHLGSGASAAAIKGGKSIDTSMGFTPAGGLMMGTRPGDLDLGAAWYMMRKDGLSPEAFNNLINHQCGLLGVSGTSSDMRDLMERAGMNGQGPAATGDAQGGGDAQDRGDAQVGGEVQGGANAPGATNAADAAHTPHGDYRAAEAISLFCYTVKKWIGSFSAALGGLETLVFTGGIGENIPQIRWRICEGLDHLGIYLDHGLNDKNAVLVSSHDSRVSVYVIPTDEEYMIAEKTSQHI